MPGPEQLTMPFEHCQADSRIEVLSRLPVLAERVQRLRSHRKCFDVHTPVAGGPSRIDDQAEQSHRGCRVVAPQVEPCQGELPAKAHAGRLLEREPRARGSFESHDDGRVDLTGAGSLAQLQHIGQLLQATDISCGRG